MFIYQDFINKKTCKELINYYEKSNNKKFLNNNKTKMTQLPIYYSQTPELNNFIKQLIKL